MAVNPDSFQKNRKDKIHSLSVDYFREFLGCAVCTFLFVIYAMMLRKANDLHSVLPPSRGFFPAISFSGPELNQNLFQRCLPAQEHFHTALHIRLFKGNGF